jgi:hypothetical protein
VSALLAVWAGLLREWDAWTTEEDSAALGVIDQAIEKQVRGRMPISGEETIDTVPDDVLSPTCKVLLHSRNEEPDVGLGTVKHSTRSYALLIVPLIVSDSSFVVFTLQKSALLPHFITAPTPPPPLPPVAPQSPLEAIAAFLADAIESVRAEGVWRACSRVHSLLHASALAFEGHEATQVGTPELLVMLKGIAPPPRPYLVYFELNLRSLMGTVYQTSQHCNIDAEYPPAVYQLHTVVRDWVRAHLDGTSPCRKYRYNRTSILCTYLRLLLRTAHGTSPQPAPSPQAVVHRVAAACATRLRELSSRAAPLAKPLVLAIATCFLCNPTVAAPALAAALGAKADNGRGQEARAGVVEWAVRLAEVVKREEHGLTDQTECQLAGERRATSGARRSRDCHT